jgi:hypothetical protein
MIYGSPFIPDFAKETTVLGGAEKVLCQEGCLNWVTHVSSAARPSLPIYHDKRTSPLTVGRSQKGQ